MRVSASLKVDLVCSFLALGGFLFGYDMIVMSGVLTMPKFLKEFRIDYSAYLFVVIITLFSAGAFGGALLSGPMADALGRKGLAAIGTLSCILGDLLLVTADATSKIYAGRVVTGIGEGMLSMVIPLYQSEIAPPLRRGRMISIQQLLVVLGMSAASWVMFGCTYINSGAQWRLPLGLQLIPALIYGLGLIWVPESPRYLLQKNQDGKALKILKRLRGDESMVDALMELTGIKQAMAYERRHTFADDYWYLFRKGHEHNRRRLFLGIGVQAFQQLTGANVLLLYAPIVLQGTGIHDRISNLFGNAISGIIVVLSTIPAVVYIDKWGRRRTMIAGAIICCLCSMVMAIVSVGDQYDGKFFGGFMSSDRTLFHVDKNATSIIFVISVYIFLASYGCTWGPLGWIYPAELYSQGVRSKALGISTASNWFFGFGVVQLAPLAFLTITWRVYVIFCVFCAVIPVIVYFYFPETKGKSLEELDLLFMGNFCSSYDVNVHHPKTAAESLAQVERLQSKYSYNFPNFGLGN